MRFFVFTSMLTRNCSVYQKTKADLLCCYTHEIVHENKGTADSSHTLQHLLRHLLRHLRFFCHTEQTDTFPV